MRKLKEAGGLKANICHRFQLNLYLLALMLIATQCTSEFTMEFWWWRTEKFNLKPKISIRDARTPQPGEIFFITMRYRSSETVQRSGYFQIRVSYIMVQIIFR